MSLYSGSSKILTGWILKHLVFYCDFKCCRKCDSECFWWVTWEVRFLILLSCVKVLCESVFETFLISHDWHYDWLTRDFWLVHFQLHSRAPLYTFLLSFACLARTVLFLQLSISELLSHQSGLKAANIFCKKNMKNINFWLGLNILNLPFCRNKRTKFIETKIL